ncbi:MAG: ATP synthase subunit I [Moraxella sp.]|uniref:ATP synthase subunit I n=1 Tax=Moraxella sp. TaxID=479 RepID=UPI0026DD382D|nr:ATP synthase subunit I [Moraxella sp.]MDO4450936.1 ATP synthase subunit I [Moraxella sp.]
MTKPAERHQRVRIYRLQFHQAWAVLMLIMVGLVLGGLGVPHAAKSMALGGMLGYVAQSVFTFVAYRTTGVRAGRMIVLNMYLGQLLKWVVTLAGFASIFMFIKPINALLVILSYFLLQISHAVAMWRT